MPEDVPLGTLLRRHRRAAGMELALPLKEAEAKVLAEVRARMNDMREIQQP